MIVVVAQKWNWISICAKKYANTWWIPLALHFLLLDGLVFLFVLEIVTRGNLFRGNHFTIGVSCFFVLIAESASCLVAVAIWNLVQKRFERAVLMMIVSAGTFHAVLFLLSIGHY